MRDNTSIINTIRGAAEFDASTCDASRDDVETALMNRTWADIRAGRYFWPEACETLGNGEAAHIYMEFVSRWLDEARGRQA